MKLILVILILKIKIILLMDQKDFKQNLCVIPEKYCSYNNNGTYCSYKCKNDYFTCGYKHCSKKKIICKHFLLNNDWKNETNLSICSIDSFKSLSSSLSSSSLLLTLTATKIITTNNDNKKEKEFEIKNETTTNNVSIIEFNKINYFIIFICVVFLFFFIFFFKNVNF
jgi:hypothetical protein